MAPFREEIVVARPKTRVLTLNHVIDVKPTPYGMLDALDLQKVGELGAEPIELTLAGMPALWVSGQINIPVAGWCADASLTTGMPLSYDERWSAGLLLLAVDGEPFAIGYGQGHRLVLDERKDHGFGVRFAARRLDPQWVQGLVRRRPGARGRTDVTLIPGGLPVWALGVEEQAEIVRRIAGRSNDVKLTFSADDSRPVRVDAGVGLTMRLGVQADRLVADIREIARVCAQEKPHSSLEFIENIRPIRDAKLGSELEAALDDLLADQGEHGRDLIPVVPTGCVEAYGQARCFSINVGPAQPRVVDSLDAEDFLSRTRHKRSGERVRALQSGNVRMYADEECTLDLGGGRALKWLEATVRRDSRQFFLVDARWYEIDVTYLKDKQAEIARLFPDKPSIDLPAWDGEKKEHGYCANVAAVRRGFVCLDTKLVRSNFLRGRGDFEACDLLGPNDELIHAKFATGSDSLSHLFAQGMVSAQALIHNSEARTRFAVRVREAGKGREIPVAYKPTKVVFAILPKKPKKKAKNGKPQQVTPDSLFPLAQVTLANAAKLLNSYGIAVEVIGIPPAADVRCPD
jgi:uncharacterized protein (TIGR04141 family)